MAHIGKAEENDNSQIYTNLHKLPEDVYRFRQEQLSLQIKPQAESYEDLVNAARVIKQKIMLAQQQGKVEDINALTEKLRMIESDIRKNEAIFRQQYNNVQEELSAAIKPEAETVQDLQIAAKIKEKQIQIARMHGDNELAERLQQEWDAIQEDIAKNR